MGDAPPPSTSTASLPQTQSSDKILPSLPPQQAEALRLLTSKCAQSGLLDPPTGLSTNDSNAGINDEATLLRFLRARKFDVEGAYAQFREASELRRANDVVSAYDGIEVEEFEEARKLYPHWTGRRDKRGLPVCIFDIAHLDSAAMAAYKKSSSPKGSASAPPEVLRAFAAHDSLSRFVLPLCDAVSKRNKDEADVAACLYLVDISGFKLKQAWTLKKYTQDISRLLATCYPEVIERVFVVGAPSCFPTIWGWIKGWIDPVTAAKLVILSSSEVLPTLREHIDTANIPKRYGGQFECGHGMLPDLDGEVRSALGWSDGDKGALPRGPIKWTEDEGGVRAAVAVGSVKGAERRETVAVLKPHKHDSVLQQ